MLFAAEGGAIGLEQIVGGTLLTAVVPLLIWFIRRTGRREDRADAALDDAHDERVAAAERIATSAEAERDAARAREAAANTATERVRAEKNAEIADLKRQHADELVRVDERHTAEVERLWAQINSRKGPTT